jgi:4-amino-4-deoxy-L-arabinose transferase-like glycosyltransferase
VPKVHEILTSTKAIVLVALIARLLYLFMLFHGQPVHAGRYLIGEETGSVAASIATGHGFSSPMYVPSGPTAWVTPVFPYLLALIFKIFGVYTFHASLAARSLNVFFSVMTCYPVVWLGSRLFGKVAGAAAGWVWAFLPTAIALPAAWLWDMSLAALMLTIALCLTYWIDDHPDAISCSLFGFVWGFAVLVNAAILSVFPGCFIFAAFRLKQHAVRWVRLSSFAALSFALAISPWIIRNQRVFHGKVLLRSNFGVELWLGNNPEVPDTWSWWLHPLDSQKEHDQFMQLGEVAYAEQKKVAAIDFIRTHPSDAARFQFHRFMETWTGHSDSFADIWAMHSPVLRADLLMNYGLAIATFTGLLLAYRRTRILSLPLLNVIVFFPIVYYVCHTTPRYRHPIDPILAVLSAYAVVSCARAIIEWMQSAVLKKQAVSADLH